MPRNTDNTRLSKMTAGDMRALSARLHKASAVLRGLAKALEEQGDDPIEVDGHKMLERAFDSISKFVGNCQKKIREF